MGRGLKQLEERLQLYVVENNERRGCRSRRKKQFKDTKTKKLRNKETWRKAIGDTGMERDTVQGRNRIRGDTEVYRMKCCRSGSGRSRNFQQDPDPGTLDKTTLKNGHNLTISQQNAHF